MGEQHRIPDPPPITDAMTAFSPGASAIDLIGTIDCTYSMPGSDRDEILLRFTNGRVIYVSCDPITHAEDGTRLPVEQWGEGWEVVLYDATESEAGEAMRKLSPGEWM